MPEKSGDGLKVDLAPHSVFTKVRFGFPKFRQSSKPETPAPPVIEDEYNNKEVAVPKLLKSINIKVENKNLVNFDSRIEAEFAYLARTRDLEFGTERTVKLEAVVNKMIEGSDVENARVIIMRKGELPDAFVMPDGTIFISQSALNMLSTWDRIGGVLAHEAKHLINRTFETKMKSKNEVMGFGVGWLHEMTADIDTCALQEKAGLNSLGLFNSELITSSARGTIHQTGTMRGVEGVGTHMVVDYTTSSNKELPKPPEFDMPVQKTNLEIFRKASNKLDFPTLLLSIPRLHPRDLETAYRILRTRNTSAMAPGTPEKLLSVVDQTEHLITSRLIEKGIDPQDVQLFWIQFRGSSIKKPITSSLAETARLIEHIAPYTDKKHAVITKIAFDHERDIVIQSPLHDALLKHAFNPEALPYEKGIPVNDELLLLALQAIEKVSTSSPHDTNVNNAKIIFEYITKTYLLPYGSNSFNETGLRNFLEMVAKSPLKLVLEDFEKPIIEDKVFPVFQKNGERPLITIPAKNLEHARQVFIDSLKEKETVPTIENIKEALSDLFSHTVVDKPKRLKASIADTQAYLKRTSYDPAETKRVADLYYEAIEAFDFDSTRSHRQSLLLIERVNGETENTIEGKTEDDATILENKRLIRFVLKSTTAMYLFDKDSEDYYDFMTRATRDAKLDLSHFNNIGLYHLITSPFDRGKIPYLYGVDEVFNTPARLEIKNFQRYCSLPFAQEYLARPHPEITNLASLLEYKLNFNMGIFGLNTYSNDPEAILASIQINENFERILEKGISYDDFDALHRYINKNFPEGIEASRLLKNIDNAMMQAPPEKVSLRQKIEYATKHIDTVGIEGLVQIAGQITTLEDFHYLKSHFPLVVEKFSSESTLPMVAGLDYLTSFLAGDYKTGLNTCDASPENKKAMSTESAKKWVRIFITRKRSIDLPWQSSISFNKSSKQFDVNAIGRELLFSFSDAIRQARSLSPSKKVGIAVKMLAEQTGAFATEDGRATLAKKVVSALSLDPKGFVARTLTAACVTADAKFVTLPAAQMIGSLLFQSLDVDAADYLEVTEEKDLDLNPLTAKEVEDVMRSPTRKLLDFQARFRSTPPNPIYLLAQASDESYYRTLAALNRLFPDERPEERESKHKRHELPSSQEAIVKAVEASTSLGIRSLQLGRQVHHFSLEMDQRLSESMDSNPGINKLIFWINYDKLVEQDPEIAEFSKRVISIGDYKGGGSLYTTYSAVLKDEQGQEKKVVLKMLNPNAGLFIDEAYKIARATLEKVAKEGTSQDRKLAQTAMSLIDLAHEWCIRDINDRDFEENDDLFRQTVEEFNALEKDESVEIPTRNLNTPKLKCEDEASGVTLNNHINSEEVPRDQTKNEVVKIARFFRFQFRAKGQYDESGRHYRRAHADPHPGNYMVEQIKGTTSVLDRHMYLVLSDEDCEMAKSLIAGNDRKFLYQFITRSIDLSKVRNPLQRRAIIATTQAKVALEWMSQKANKESDSFGLLRTAIASLESQRVDVPLKLRLLTRNVIMQKRLLKDYGTSFDEI